MPCTPPPAAIGDAIAYAQATYMAPNRSLRELLAVLQRCACCHGSASGWR
jgi:hypothetical protein